MKFKIPKNNPKPKRIVPLLNPLLERLFTHANNHPNDKCAWEIIKFHQHLYNAWVSRMPKKKSLDN